MILILSVQLLKSDHNAWYWYCILHILSLSVYTYMEHPFWNFSFQSSPPSYLNRYIWFYFYTRFCYLSLLIIYDCVNFYIQSNGVVHYIYQKQVYTKNYDKIKESFMKYSKTSKFEQFHFWFISNMMLEEIFGSFKQTYIFIKYCSRYVNNNNLTNCAVIYVSQFHIPLMIC